MLPRDAKHKKILLIDDDEIYNAIMLRAAAIASVDLDVYPSLLALGSVIRLGQYDAVVVDYHLEHMTGIEIAEYLSAFFEKIPMILVSSSPTVPDDARAWPDSIASFIQKSAGYVHVLEQAAQLADRPPPRHAHGLPSRPVVKAAGKTYHSN